jgi:hypothetical protein
MALPEVVSSAEWLKGQARAAGPGWAIVMLVTDAVATTLTELGAPRHAETPRSGDIPERWRTGGSPPRAR